MDNIKFSTVEQSEKNSAITEFKLNVKRRKNSSNMNMIELQQKTSQWRNAEGQKYKRAQIQGGAGGSRSEQCELKDVEPKPLKKNNKGSSKRKP